MAAGILIDDSGRSTAVDSNSCFDVRVGADASQKAWGQNYVSTRCSSDPVVAGTTIYFYPSGQWVVQSITATATAPAYSASSLTVKVEPAPPSAERMADLSTLFGLSIAFLVVVYGSKQLLKLFTSDHEKD